jgi:hypothetical protein
MKSADTVFMSQLYVLQCLKHLRFELGIKMYSDFDFYEFEGIKHNDLTEEQQDKLTKIIKIGA